MALHLIHKWFTFELDPENYLLHLVCWQFFIFSAVYIDEKIKPWQLEIFSPVMSVIAKMMKLPTNLVQEICFRN